MFVCWDCEKVCPTNDALKVHVATHGFTRVFCPWCFDQHRHYRRMVDLRQHVKNAHPTIFKKEGDVPFLKEKSGFYLADNPKEYRKAMGSVPLDVTPAALFLKEAVEDWCSNFKGVVERPLTTWRQLWAQFGGIFSPEQEPSLDYGYTPTRPDLDTVYTIDLEATGATAVMYGPTGDGCSAFRRITFTDRVISDAKKRERLLRRMKAISSKATYPPPPIFWEEDKIDGQKFLKRMVDALGMEMADVNKVEKRKICKKRPLATETLPGQSGDNVDVTCEDPPAEKDCRQPDSTLPTPTDEPAEVIHDTSSDEPPKDVTAFPTETPLTATTTTLQERALALFTTGAMPLFPPARRDWTSGVEIQLPIPGSLSMWPPAGWKTMSADIKLLLWETVSTLLATLVFQAIPEDRGLLLDTFQFLALPGTRERKLVSPFQMMRHSSFTTVRKIAAGDYHLSDATTLIEQFEAACLSSPKPELYQLLINAIKEVPLRIR